MLSRRNIKKVVDGQLRVDIFIENIKDDILHVFETLPMGVDIVEGSDINQRLLVFSYETVKVPKLTKYYGGRISDLDDKWLKASVLALLWFNNGAKEATKKKLTTYVIQNFIKASSKITYEVLRPLVDKWDDEDLIRAQTLYGSKPLMYSYKNTYTTEEKISLSLKAYHRGIKMNLGSAFDSSVDAFALKNKRLKVTTAKVVGEMNESSEKGSVSLRSVRKAVLPTTVGKILEYNSETPRLIGTTSSEVKYLESKKLFAEGVSNKKASRDLGISRSTVITYREVFINESKE